MCSQRNSEQRSTCDLKEGIRSLDWIGEFIEQEKIDCDFQRVGRLRSPYPKTVQFTGKKIVNQPEGLEVPIELITGRSSIAKSERIFTMEASFIPSMLLWTRQRFHQGLLEAALSSGVSIKPQCEVQEILQAKDFSMSPRVPEWSKPRTW